MKLASEQKKQLQKDIIPFSKPCRWRSNGQLTFALLSHIACWAIAYQAYKISIWLCLAVAILSSAIFLRTFIIMHDCVHSSFYKNNLYNHIWGFVTGILTFSDYSQWVRTHLNHHKTNGQLERRGIGDFKTLTVEEYEALSRWGKLYYKIERNPFVYLTVGPALMFIVFSRFWYPEDRNIDRISVIGTNLGILAIAIVITQLTSLEFYLFFQIAVVWISGAIGIALFYVQHQFDNPYWKERGEWDYFEASLKGSSYLKLPKILQWATGSIGFHHIHHLFPAVPNYKLESSYKNIELFQNCTVLSVWDCFRCFFLSLYDTKSGRLISFSEYNRQLTAKG